MISLYFHSINMTLHISGTVYLSKNVNLCKESVGHGQRQARPDQHHEQLGHRSGDTSPLWEAQVQHGAHEEFP